ncbi:MAG: excinuclease ABC subunit UvrC [Candidatus Omnitrophica bacterium]|nr:excinuclease ABC subunit UvrC [Candidatus Omnitrophota bacterium]
MGIPESLAQVPLSSGVYFMKDGRGNILYVGKAVCLRKRVQSYFRKAHPPFSKTDLLVAEIKNIDWMITSSEAEALLLEASLIKKYHPKYNIELRDDKSYPFILITSDEYPRIAIVRPKTEKAGAQEGKLFGPYVDSKLIREALILIRKIFHYRTCRAMPKKACLDHHMGLCDAPCIKNISVSDYQKLIRHITFILEGRKDELSRYLRKEMEGRVKAKEFEKAAVLRDQIRAVGALYSGTKDINYYKEAEQLKLALSLKKIPQRIEAFDISNLMGHQAVGSMVSFLNGASDKQNYRRFRIREVQGIDDFQMIAEVVRRRYLRLKNEGALFPDLILIDGGKGQLSAAKAELDKLNLNVPIASLAKREEEVFLPHKRSAVILKKDSLGLKLLERIRDEAHRFAVSYHRNLRSKKVFY